MILLRGMQRELQEEPKVKPQGSHSLGSVLHFFSKSVFSHPNTTTPNCCVKWGSDSGFMIGFCCLSKMQHRKGRRFTSIKGWGSSWWTVPGQFLIDNCSCWKSLSLVIMRAIPRSHSAMCTRRHKIVYLVFTISLMKPMLSVSLGSRTTILHEQSTWHKSNNISKVR